MWDVFVTMISTLGTFGFAFVVMIVLAIVLVIYLTVKEKLCKKRWDFYNGNSMCYII